MHLNTETSNILSIKMLPFVARLLSLKVTPVCLRICVCVCVDVDSFIGVICGVSAEFFVASTRVSIHGSAMMC